MTLNRSKIINPKQNHGLIVPFFLNFLKESFAETLRKKLLTIALFF